MSELKSIRISQFKFFAEATNLDIDGKHLLLYGENGSGKSSLSYALYTILEASAKTEVDVKKYFELRADSNESLLNIYSNQDNGAENTGAYIEVEDTENRVYRLSYTDTAICGNPTLQLSNRASDFISYQSLFHFQMARNSEKTELRDVFIKSIFPNLSFPKYENMTSVSEMWTRYMAGPGTTLNKKEKLILVYKRSHEYKWYQGLENHINKHLEKLIEIINANAPSVIKYLGYNLKFELTFKAMSHKKKDIRIDYEPFSIGLRITNYNGIAVEVEHPNTFLNEAKMSAVAFSIRWAILQSRLTKEVAPDAMKFLILDDLMISLDMGNRKKMISYIVQEVTKKTQVLFLTHDKTLFESVKLEIENQASSNWLVKEMYEVERDSRYLPKIQDYKSLYAQALAWYNGSGCDVDYCACGNALRKAIEGEYKRLFRIMHVVNNNGSVVDVEQMMIGACVNIGKRYFALYDFSSSLLAETSTLSKYVLNPSSHYNPQSDLYRQELKEAFTTLENLQKCSIVTLVPCDEKITFIVNNNAGVQYDYTIELKDAIFAAHDHTTNKYHIVWKKTAIHISRLPDNAEDDRATCINQIYAYMADKYGDKRYTKDQLMEFAGDEIFYKGESLSSLCAGLNA